jgi:hypothetical protein
LAKDENIRIRIRFRIRIHQSEDGSSDPDPLVRGWIRGSGSAPKSHGSATLLHRNPPLTARRWHGAGTDSGLRFRASDRELSESVRGGSGGGGLPSGNTIGRRRAAADKRPGSGVLARLGAHMVEDGDGDTALESPPQPAPMPAYSEAEGVRRPPGGNRLGS